MIKVITILCLCILLSGCEDADKNSRMFKARMEAACKKHAGVYKFSFGLETVDCRDGSEVPWRNYTGPDVAEELTKIENEIKEGK